MGTDICIYAEKHESDHWTFIGKMVENRSYHTFPQNEPRHYPEGLYRIRNYALFAILADVRNEEGYECIAPRRGIPEDLSPQIQTHFATYLSDTPDSTWIPPDEQQRAAWTAFDNDTTLRPGWLTLEELVTFPWHEKRIKIYAMVDKQVEHLFPEQGEGPFPLQGWPEGLSYGYSTAQKDDTFWNASWIQTYAEAVGSDFLDLLASFVEQYGVTRDIRFVFWFI